jgi:threonine dehydratase
MFVEPAGAAALAAIISGKYKPKIEEKLAVLICGANPNTIPEF